jgi:hypothetical protein
MPGQRKRTEMIEGLLFWIGLGAVVGYWLGHTKGRVEDGVRYGALLGPIGWIIILSWQDLRPSCEQCGGLW